MHGIYWHVVIPDYAKMRWLVRAPTAKEAEVFTERVKKCFECVTPRSVVQFPTLPCYVQIPGMLVILTISAHAGRLHWLQHAR